MPKVVSVSGGASGAIGCNSPSGAPTAGIGGATGADGVGEGGADTLKFNRNSRAPALEAGGSAEFGAALKTADR